MSGTITRTDSGVAPEFVSLPHRFRQKLKWNETYYGLRNGYISQAPVGIQSVYPAEQLKESLCPVKASCAMRCHFATCKSRPCVAPTLPLEMHPNGP